MKENKFLINRKMNSINKKAFSLVEVLLAIVLLAIIATPILSVFYTSMSLNLRSKEIMAATDVSSGILECIEKSDAISFKNAATNKNFNKYPFLKNMYTSSSNCIVTGNTIKLYDLNYKKSSADNGYVFDVIVYLLDDTTHGTDLYYINDVRVEVYKNNKDGESTFQTSNLSSMNGSVINID